jgi:DNA replication protein DnaC
MSQESELLDIANYAKALRLPAIGANFADILAQAKRDGWSHLRFITELLSLELNEREARRCQRLLIEAKIPRTKLLGEFNLADSSITTETLEFLVRGDFCDVATSVVLVGGPGTGKTHLLIGTLVSLAAKGKKVRYTNAATLVNELHEAQDDHRLSKVIERYQRLDVLGIDELGYLQLDRRGAELLFQVITEREEQSSLMVATNLPFSEWNGIFSDPRLAGAVVDRITFNSKIIETGSSSFRLRSAIATKQKK